MVTVFIWSLPILIAVTFYEAVQGWGVWRLGDLRGFWPGILAGLLVEKLLHSVGVGVS